MALSVAGRMLLLVSHVRAALGELLRHLPVLTPVALEVHTEVMDEHPGSCFGENEHAEREADSSAMP